MHHMHFLDKSDTMRSIETGGVVGPPITEKLVHSGYTVRKLAVGSGPFRLRREEV